jgi:type IV pilus assembly protein PilY1
MKHIHQLRMMLASTLTASMVFSSAISHADDTEVFFGGPGVSQGLKPNVFFILDNSGSMADSLGKNKGTRMDALKDAFQDILTNTDGVNIGVMALNSRDNFYKNRLVYPVEYIDNPIGISAVAPDIVNSTDDAYRQNNMLSTNIDSPTLVMGHITPPAPTQVIRSLGQPNDQGYPNDYSTFYLKGSYTCSVNIATARDNCDTGIKTTLNARSRANNGQDGLLLFRNLNIPAGVTITNATLTITPNNDQTSNKPGFKVEVNSSKTTPALDDASLLGDVNFTAITPANLSSSSSLLEGSWTTGNEFKINITSQIQNLQTAAPSTDPIGEALIKIRSTTDRNYLYLVGDNEKSPKLTITYTGNEDAKRTTGLRFQNVAIPQGAKITSAYLDFVAASSDDRPVSFSVSAENSGNAAAFSTSENFTGRTKTAATNWKPQAWYTQSPPPYLEGPSVINQVQQVVDNSAWCGNNAMAFFITPEDGNGSRTTYSIDGSPLKPVLRVNYEGGEDGCLNPVFEARVTKPKNDGHQTSSGVNLTSTQLNFGRNNTIASRYENLPIKRNAEVLEAQVIVTNSTSSGSSTVTVGVHNNTNSAELQASNNNLSNRSSTGNFTCTLSGNETSCSGTTLNTALTNIFKNSNWNDGNALTILLKATDSNSNNFQAHSYDGSPSQSIKLRLKLSSGSLGNNFLSVRNHLSGLVKQMDASGGTPIGPAMYNAARYLSEKYHTDIFSAKSPIESACQPTHLVLLTDGEPQTNLSDSDKTALQSMIGQTCANKSYETCTRELAYWMANTDQSTFDGDNFINTHTVGFALTNQSTKTFLQQVATAGNGNFYSAEDAATLADSFNQIIQEVLATDTTFVSASAAVNTFNRQDNKDEVYFSLFRPTNKESWPGNLKRYKMVAENGTLWLADADNSPAIDNQSGFFRADARSFWSTSTDGSNVAAGGAASMLPALNARKLLTNVTPNSNELTNINTANNLLTAEKIGAANSTDRANYINYLRGADPVTPDTARKSMGDPLHSTPSLVTYQCNTYDTNRTCTSEDQSALVATNEGYVHLFNTNTGAEQFAFMPDVLLPNSRLLRDNAVFQKRTYGMDNTVSVWVNDVNKNGVIFGGINPDDPTGAFLNGQNPNEFVYAYATMGRGGNNIYALDITNRSSPKLVWKIQGGITPGFSNLGQTWSVPVKTRIKVGGTITDVLVFGGGYDPNQDDVKVRTPDATGNAIYIVNAKTGALVWSASSANGHSVTLNKMRYSIPSKVTVIPLYPDAEGNVASNPENLAGQIFVGDMGGQVWRLHINNGSSGSALVTPGGTGGDGVMASVAGEDAANARRFYQEPEIALLTVNNKQMLTVNLGSGYRGHPLDKNINDRFYSFRTSLVKNANETTLTEGAMYDATINTAQDNAELAGQIADNINGWYIRFDRAGEKVMTRALIADGVMLFSTYEPQANTDLCKASVGKSRAYTTRLSDATGLTNERFVTNNTTSLPSNPQIYCQGNACWVYHDPSQLTKQSPSQTTEAENACKNSANPEKCICDRNPQCIWMPTTPRLYWIDEE